MNTAAEAATAFAMTLRRVATVNLVGSTYILGQGKDIDVLVLTASRWDTAEELEDKGWVIESDAKYAESKFVSCRKGDVNLLLTDNEEFFDAFVTAAEVCKLLRIEDRPTRIAIHKVVRDGLDAEEAVK